MKIKGAKAVHYDSGPNMTPLVDVVMVILIFLMLAGSFGGTTHYLMSKAGIKSKGGYKVPPPPGFVPDVDFDITVHNATDGMGFVAIINHDRTVTFTDPDKLTAALVGRYNGLSDRKHTQVVLYPDREVHFEYIMQVYQSALKANFAKIAFATTG